MPLSLATMEKILKEAGANRVSEDAKEALREFLEREGRRIAVKAAKLAEHANRRTVQGKDIRIAHE